VVHRRLSSIVVVPGCLSFVVPSVVCCLRRHTALVHPQSTRRAVARQRGGGCSVDRHRRPPSLSFVIVVRHCRSSLSFVVHVVVVPRCRPPLSSFVLVLVPVLVPVLIPVLVVHCRHSLSSFVVVVVVHVVVVPRCRPPSSSFVLVIVPVLVPVLVIVPPAVHPTSSCS
jgi:hypothetical protein